MKVLDWPHTIMVRNLKSPEDLLLSTGCAIKFTQFWCFLFLSLFVGLGILVLREDNVFKNLVGSNIYAVIGECFETI